MRYGAYKPYGVGSINMRGNQADKVHRFATSQEREDWIAEDETFREAVLANSQEVRKAKKAARDFDLTWPIPV